MHCGERLCIVGSKLWVNRIWRGEQFARASKEGGIAVDFTREDGEVVETVNLRALYLRVPVGALNEPNHQPAAGMASEIDQPIDDERAPLAISLYHEASPFHPASSGSRLSDSSRSSERSTRSASSASILRPMS